MKYKVFLFLLLISGLGSLRASADSGTLPSMSVNETESAPLLPSKRIGMFLMKGQTVQAAGFEMFIQEVKAGNSGRGVMYFPALEMDLNVAFERLQVTAEGEILAGEIRTATGLPGDLTDEKASAGAWTQVLRADKSGYNLPRVITEDLVRIKDFNLPRESEIILDGLRVTSFGAFADLSFSAASLVEGNYLDFKGENILVPSDDFCLEGVNLDLGGGDGGIDDFEFPMRILKGNPDEEGEGSYITFSCDGFENFNLQAEYPFPNDQLVPAESGVDTVFARFNINSPSLGNFLVAATVDPFEIPGVDGMVFTIDSAYVDYSDLTNAPDFVYADEATGEQVDEQWKGVFMRELSIQLPPSVSAFKGEEGLTVGGRNIVYDRGSGITAQLFAENILNISEGNMNGWGLSIDTLNIDITYNSFEELNLNGDLYIPVTAQGDNIAYNCNITNDENGDPAVVFALDIVGEYTVPFLGDVTMTLSESSMAGVRYTSAGGFEPYANFSGELTFDLGGEGTGIPKLEIPGITFQDFKLNDIDVTPVTDMADQATAGIDRMSFGSFGFGVPGFSELGGDDTPPPTPSNSSGSSPAYEKKFKNFKFTVNSIDFGAEKEGDTELKKLALDITLNFTKGETGITGQGLLEIYGKVNYTELISTTPWQALSYERLGVGEFAIDCDFTGFRVAGGINAFDDDPKYGTGFKGAVILEGHGFSVNAMAQFGVSDYSESGGGGDDYRYFFVDASVMFGAPINMTAVDLYGLSGGLYYNMDKTYEVDGEFGGSSELDMTPGTSFSGATYTPKSGSLGFSAGVIGSLAGSPRVFSFDAELSMQFNYETLGLENIQFKGDGYIMAKNMAERKQASIQAELVLKLDFENGVMTSNFAFTGKYPDSNPFFTASGQGAIQLDMNPDDDTEYDNFFFFGKPTSMNDMVSGKLGIGGANLDMNAYFMFGENLPEPMPLSEIHSLFADIPAGSSTGDGDGIAFGFNVNIPEKNFRAGPIKAYFSATFGMDASIKKYTGVSCEGSGEIGMNGWYLKSRAYLAIEGGVDIEVDLRFWSGTVNLMELSVAAAIQAELPNPTWLRGDLQVRGSVLGGRVRVNKKFDFEIGEKCIIQIDESALIAEIKIISAMLPEFNEEDETKSAGEKETLSDEPFKIWSNPTIAFDRYIDFGTSVPASGNLLSIDPGPGLPKFKFYPYIAEFEFKKKNGNEVDYVVQWNDAHTIMRSSPKDALEPESEYVYRMKINWRSKKNSEPWKDVKNDDGSYFGEYKGGYFTTGGMPETMAMEMLEAENHFPGYRQRNYHPAATPGEIHFGQGNLGDQMFNEVKTKTFEGEDYEISYDYEVRVTNLATEEMKSIPITEKPGDSSYETLSVVDYEIEIQTDTLGGTTPVTYQKIEKVAQNSRVVKFHAISEPGFLEPGVLYNLQIVGVPRPDNSLDESATVTAINNAQDSLGGGYVVEGVSTELVDNSSPFKGVDVIYSYEFRTSKYASLQEKVENMLYVGEEQTIAYEGTGHPKVNEEANYDMSILPQDDEYVDQCKVSDNYHVYKIDEGFDGWERYQLKINLFPQADSYEEFDNLPHFKTPIQEHQNLDLPDTWLSLFDADPWNWEENGKRWMYDIDFPKNSGSVADEDKGLYPQLTQSEIDNKQVNDMVLYTGKGIDSDNKFNFSQKWDLAVVSKRRRVGVHQIMALRRAYANYEYVFRNYYHLIGTEDERYYGNDYYVHYHNGNRTRQQCPHRGRNNWYLYCESPLFFLSQCRGTRHYSPGHVRANYYNHERRWRDDWGHSRGRESLLHAARYWNHQFAYNLMKGIYNQYAPAQDALEIKFYYLDEPGKVFENAREEGGSSVSLTVQDSVQY